MPQLDHILLADGVSPRPDGKIDIYGATWDKILAPSVPARHPQIAIVLRVLITAQEAEQGHTIDLVLMGPDGPELARTTANVQPASPDVLAAWPAGERMGLGAVVQLQNLVLPEFGSYHIAILWDGSELRPPITLKVEQLPLPPALPEPE